APGASTPTTIAGANALQAIACPSTLQCVTVDLVGNGFAGFAPPVNSSPPAIAGTAQQGQTLTEQHGTWMGPTTGYGYQWQDCDSQGSACTAISGATAQTYT